MSARSELESIKAELASIINELEDIAAGVQKDFLGIDNYKCSFAINDVKEDLERAKLYLINVVLEQENVSPGGGNGAFSLGGSSGGR